MLYIYIYIYIYMTLIVIESSLVIKIKGYPLESHVDML
jgi:hypothetical protein